MYAIDLFSSQESTKTCQEPADLMREIGGTLAGPGTMAATPYMYKRQPLGSATNTVWCSSQGVECQFVCGGCAGRVYHGGVPTYWLSRTLKVHVTQHPGTWSRVLILPESQGRILERRLLFQVGSLHHLPQRWPAPPRRQSC